MLYVIINLYWFLIIGLGSLHFYRWLFFNDFSIPLTMLITKPNAWVAQMDFFLTLLIILQNSYASKNSKLGLQRFPLAILGTYQCTGYWIQIHEKLWGYHLFFTHSLISLNISTYWFSTADCHETVTVAFLVTDITGCFGRSSLIVTHRQTKCG